MTIPLRLQPPAWCGQIQRPRRRTLCLPLRSFLLFLPKAEGRTFPVLTTCPSSSPSWPREGGSESHNVVTQSAHCHCLALFKGNAVGSPVEFLTLERSYMFSLGQVFLTSFVMSTIPISCSCVENCFVMKDLHWGIEQHLIKSMFVFCLCCLCFFWLWVEAPRSSLLPFCIRTYTTIAATYQSTSVL